MKEFAPTIILLNYNGAADTLECLASLQQAALGTASVIVVENGSTDDSMATLRGWNAGTGYFACVEEVTAAPEPDFSAAAVAAVGPTLLCSPTNRGFAGGNNLATRLALARGGTEVLLLNNDTTVAPDFLRHLARARQQYPQAVLIPQIRYFFEPDLIWNCGGDLRWPGRKHYRLAGAPVSAVPAVFTLQVSFVTGCALLYRPGTTGLLTERFFFGEEDMEFSLRLRHKGIPAYCVVPAIVYHKVGRSLEDNARKSEIFTLKRLVNLRQQLPPVTFCFALLYYLANLFRLFIRQYGLQPVAALRLTFRTAHQAFVREEVGKDLCVDYVRGGNPDS